MQESGQYRHNEVTEREQTYPKNLVHPQAGKSKPS